jgi:hypothetical protein
LCPAASEEALVAVLLGPGTAAAGDADGEVCWANAKLQHTLHADQSSGRLFLQASVGGATEWLDVRSERLQAAVFSHECEGSRFACEVYWREAQAAGCCLWWTLPALVSVVFGDNPYRNFMGKALGRWREILVRGGFPGDVIRASKEARVKKARSIGAAVPAELTLSSEQEYSIASSGLLYLLAAITGSTRAGPVRKDEGGGMQSERLLHLILEKFFGGADAAWRTPEGWAMQLRGGLLELRPVHEAALRPPTEGLRQVFRGCERLPLAAVLVRLAAGCFHAQRGKAWQGHARSMAASLCVQLAAYMDCTQGQAMWAEVTHLQLGVRRGRGKRPHRLPFTLKRLLQEAAAQEPALSGAMQIVAAGRILGANGPTAHHLNPRSCHRFVTDTMYQYWLALRQLGQQARHHSLSLDAGRVSGEELLLIADWVTPPACGCWLPFQVRRSRGPLVGGGAPRAPASHIRGPLVGLGRVTFEVLSAQSFSWSFPRGAWLWGPHTPPSPFRGPFRAVSFVVLSARAVLR